MSAAAAAVAIPRKRVPRPKALHPSKTGEEVRKSLRGRAGNWMFMPRAFIPDLFRVCKSVSEAAVLAVIQSYTAGSPKSRGGKTPDFTPSITPLDFAKETGFSEHQVRESLDAVVARGLAERKCGCTGQGVCRGTDHYKFRLLCEQWEKQPNAFIPRNNALQNMGEEEENTRGTAIPPVQPIRLNKPVRLTSGRQFELPQETPARLIEVEKADGADIVATIADGGLLRIRTRAPLVDQNTPPKAAAPPPSPPAAAMLQEGLAACQVYLGAAEAAQLAAKLVCPVEWFIGHVQTRFKTGSKVRRPAALLPALVAEWNDKWPAAATEYRRMEADLKRQEESRRRDEIAEHLRAIPGFVAETAALEADYRSYYHERYTASCRTVIASTSFWTAEDKQRAADLLRQLDEVADV